MGLLRKIAGILGFGGRDDSHGGADGGQVSPEDAEVAAVAGDNGHRRGGFSVQVPVAVDRPAVGPVLVPCALGHGGIQGLRWYSRRLRVDEDGDVADEFLEEVKVPESSMSIDPPHPQSFKFQSRYPAIRPVIRQQTIAPDGSLRHDIVHQGKLLCV